MSRNGPSCTASSPNGADNAATGKKKGRGTAALKRSIGLFGATAIGIGAIIGSGIFIVTGLVAGLAGPALVGSILIAGFIAVFSALSVAELSCFLPEEGGTYSFAYRLISPLAGFIAGWIWIFSNIFVGAAVSLGFAQYFVTFIPGVSPKVIAVLICLLFVGINAAGIEELAFVNSTLVVLKIIILVFFVVLGTWFLQASNFVPLAPQGPTGILQGAALIFFAYTGFARITIMAEEVRNPDVIIPQSIYLALGISTVLYIAVGIVAVGLAGTAALAASESPLTTAIAMTGLAWAGPLVTIGALIATASVLLTTILGISRIVYAMSRNGDLPLFLSKVHPLFGTPQHAVFITGAGIVGAILFADLALMVGVSTFAMLVYYLIANGAAMKIPWDRRRYPMTVPVLGAMTCFGLVVFLTREAWIIGCIGLAAGLAIHTAMRLLKAP